MQLIETTQSHESDLKNKLLQFVHTARCKCDSCKFPQVKFYNFQITTLYSRLLWLMENFNMSKELNEVAFDEWSVAHQKVLRSKEFEFLGVNKKSFNLFSIRWLFQVADTYMKLADFSKAEDIYNEIELICVPNIFDYDFLKQTLVARKESLEFIMKYGEKKEEIEKGQFNVELSFDEFMKHRGVTISATTTQAITPSTPSSILKQPNPLTIKKPATKKTAITNTVLKSATRPKKKASPSTDKNVIFVDSDDESKDGKAKNIAINSKPSTRPTRMTSKSTVDLTKTPTASTPQSRRMI